MISSTTGILKTSRSNNTFSAEDFQRKKNRVKFAHSNSMHVFVHEETPAKNDSPPESPPKVVLVNSSQTNAQNGVTHSTTIFPNCTPGYYTEREHVRILVVLFFVMIASVAYMASVSLINHRISVISAAISTTVFVFCLSAIIFLVKDSENKLAVKRESFSNKGC